MNLLTILISVISLFLRGSDENSFKSGRVELKDSSMTCEIKLDLENNTLVVRKDNVYTLITARDIENLTLDGIDYLSREFEGKQYLFEVLYSGGLTLLFRSGLHFQYEETVFLPFFLDLEGSVAPMYKVKDLTEIFGPDEKWMSVFIRNHKLDLASKSDLKIALEYYKDQKL